MHINITDAIISIQTCDKQTYILAARFFVTH